jgi:UDP-N-acetyl-D-mannosaminuronic acid dehydrogenase/UDP-N-acetyl-D-glucosamine dehydrogenase
MPDYVVSLVVRQLNQARRAVNGSRILLVGLAYKANSRDARQSPAITVAMLLDRLGAEVSAADPLIEPDQVPAFIDLVPCDRAHVDGADLVIVLAAHDGIDWELLEHHADRVLDTCNRLSSPATSRL